MINMSLLNSDEIKYYDSTAKFCEAISIYVKEINGEILRSDSGVHFGISVYNDLENVGCWFRISAQHLRYNELSEELKPYFEQKQKKESVSIRVELLKTVIEYLELERRLCYNYNDVAGAEGLIDIISEIKSAIGNK